MPPNDRSGAQDPPTDAEEFGERLAWLLSAAAADGIDIRRGGSADPRNPTSPIVM